MYLQDGGPVELTTDDMSDDELLSYIKTEEEVKATVTSHDQLNSQGKELDHSVI